MTRVRAGSIPPEAPHDDPVSMARDSAVARAVEWSAIVHVVRPLAADLLATFAFYAVFAASGSVGLATVLAMALGVGQLAWTLATGRGAAPTQVASLALVIVVGLLAIVTHDPRYMLYKASMIYLAVGAAMLLQPGWLARYVPPVATAYLSPAMIALFGRLWAALILGTGLMSVVLILSQPVRIVALVMAVWGPSSKIALLAGQYLIGRVIVRREIIDRLSVAANVNARGAAG